MLGRFDMTSQTYPQLRKMPSVSTHRASSGTHILAPIRVTHSCFKGLTGQSVSAAPVPARVQVAITTKACGQQPTCIRGTGQGGEGTSKHSSAQALMAVAATRELAGRDPVAREREGSIQHIQTCP